MRLLIAARSIPKHREGGMEAVAWDVARGLSRAGHDITLLTTKVPGAPGAWDEEGVHVETLNCTPGVYSPEWWTGSERFGHEHADAFDAVLGVSAAANGLLGLASRMPVVFQAHGTSSGEIVSKLRSGSARSAVSSIKNARALAADGNAYPRYTAIVAVGATVQRQLSSAPTKWIRGATPVHFIPNGIDPAPFAFSPEAHAKFRERHQIRQRDKVVASICRLDPQKGMAQAIKAVQLAAREDDGVQFFIAGTGRQEAELKALASKLAVQDRVRFLGRLERAEVGELLSGADLFLAPTLRVEVGATIATMEALASGLDVVTSWGGYTPGLPMRVVSPRNVEEIAEAIDTAPIRRDRPSALPDRYTLDRMIRSYADLFTELRMQGRLAS